MGHRRTVRGVKRLELWGGRMNADRSISTPAGTFSYSYDAAGRPTGLTNPAGHTAAWSYLNNDWLVSESRGTLLTFTFAYNALGKVTVYYTFLGVG